MLLPLSRSTIFDEKSLTESICQDVVYQDVVVCQTSLDERLLSKRRLTRRPDKRFNIWHIYTKIFKYGRHFR